MYNRISYAGRRGLVEDVEVEELKYLATLKGMSKNRNTTANIVLA